MSAIAVTAYLINNLKEIKGKKAYQKLIYLAKAVGVPLDESYRMYYYGPYSEQVAEELETSIYMGIIENVENSYSFIPGEKAKEILEESKEFIEDNKSKLDRLVNAFGKYDPMKLEILATTHFIYNNMKYLYGNSDRGTVIEEVKKAKSPKFSDKEIEQSYDLLIKEKLI